MSFVVGGILGSGGVLALGACGFSLLYWLTGVANLAQGSLVIVGALSSWELQSKFHFPVLLAGAIAVGAGFALGYLLWRYIIGRAELKLPLFRLIVGFACGLGLAGGLALIVTANFVWIPTKTGTDQIAVANMAVPLPDVIAGLVGVAAALAISWTIRSTRIGLVLRAISDDHDAARLLGVRSVRLVYLVAGIAGALAALGGVFAVWSGAVATSEVNRYTIDVAVAGVAGRLGSLRGAVAASFLLAALSAVVEEWSSHRLIELCALGLVLAGVWLLPTRKVTP